MNKEYSIACCLDKRSQDELRELIPFLDKNNLPHVSLFQFKLADDKFLSLADLFLEDIILSQQLLTRGISIVEDNIFLDITNTDQLQSISNQCADLYDEHCQHKKPLSQIVFDELTESDKTLVDKYGIYWIKQNFRPHVTLAYTNKIDIRGCRYPEYIYVQQPQLYIIDEKGRIV